MTALSARLALLFVGLLIAAPAQADRLARITIGRTVEIIDDSRATPNQLGGWSPATARLAARLSRPATIRRRMRATLLSHPERFAAICAYMQTLARQYDDPTAQAGDYSVIDLLQIAAMMDTQVPHHCVGRILDIVPHTRNADSSIEIAAEFCSGSPWHGAGCKEIARGQSDR